MHLIGLIPVEVSIELSRIGVGEGFYLKFDEDMALEGAVVEDEVDKVVVFPNEDFLLSLLKAEASA